MTIILLANNIEWDTDGDETEAQRLPKQLEVEVNLKDVDGGWTDINDQICNQLSDETGWLVLDYQLTGYTLNA